MGPYTRPHYNLEGDKVIKVNRLNGEEIVVNADLIEIVKSTPDTIIKLTTNKKILVEESVDDVIDKVIEYKRKVFNNLMLDKE